MNLVTIILVLVWVVGGSLFVCKVVFPISEQVGEGGVVATKKVNTQSYSTKVLYNEKLDIYKPYHEGFSWTVLLFGFFPALFRSDWKWAVIIFLCNWVFWLPACIFFAIKYNELYVKDLMQQGYKVISKA